MSRIRTITADDLEQALADGTVAEFWNVLTAEYFGGDIIPGSRHVPLDRVGREVADAGIARDAAVVVYCSGPTCPQSKAAAEKLVALGFTNVRAFEGGLAAWKESGRPLESAVATAAGDR